MSTGAITNYIDVAQLTLYGFWIFFAGLIYYLRSEDKREGYPLESDRSGRVRVQGFPPIPNPKTFRLEHGETRSAPRAQSAGGALKATPVGAWPGAPLEPNGDPMADGVGPAAYAQRPDVPDRTIEGHAKIVPLRVATDFTVAARDPDPRGMDVIAGDGLVAGKVSDVWVDRSETIARYYEVQVGNRSVLLPANFARVDKWRRRLKVKSVYAHHFATAPAPRDPNQVTLLEEDRICAYFASGNLYAHPSRLGPWI
jgi:photosynthetic reaction center H subunit